MNENEVFPKELRERVRQAGVIAVVTLDDPEDAPALGRALIAGGILGVELTLRTAAGIEAIRRLRGACPDFLIGAGTVIFPQQVEQVKNAGADFAVSPGCQAAVLEEAKNHGVPFAPGICAPSDIEVALSLGCQLLKFFPAEASGGLAYLNNIAAPYAHCGLGYIPLGGVGPKNLTEYLASPYVAAVGGSWLAPKDLLQAKAWEKITDLAREASGIVKSSRG